MLIELSQVELLARSGASIKELKRVRDGSMVECTDFRRDGHLGKIVYLVPGLQKLAAAGIPIPEDAAPPRPEVMIKILIAQHRNNRVMTGELAGTPVLVRCRDSKNFLPGMMVPCLLEEGVYWVRRHPRWRGKW